MLFWSRIYLVCQSIFHWLSKKIIIFRFYSNWKRNKRKCYITITKFKYFNVLHSHVDMSNRNFKGIKNTSANTLPRCNSNDWELMWAAVKVVEQFRMEDFASLLLFEDSTHVFVLQDVSPDKTSPQPNRQPGNVQCDQHTVAWRPNFNWDCLYVLLLQPQTYFLHNTFRSIFSWFFFFT